MCEDSNRNVGQLTLMGQALTSTLNQLERQGLWDQVPNIPLVLSMFIWAASEFKSLLRGWGGESSWPRIVHAYAIKHDVVIEGIYNIEKKLAQFPVDDLTLSMEKMLNAKASKDKWKFKLTWLDYVDAFGHWKSIISRRNEIKIVGGRAYDVSRMSETERKRNTVAGLRS